MLTRTRKHRSRLAAAMCALTVSLSLAPATAGAARTAIPTDRDHLPADKHDHTHHNEIPRRQLQVAQTVQALTARATFYRNKTWYYEQVMGVALTRSAPTARSVSGIAGAAGSVAVWRRRAAAAWRKFSHPPNYRNWLCIQRHETAPPFPGWKTDSGNTYYGGVQMDMTFMRNYGAFLLNLKGTSNNWTKLEQIWVAEKGRRVQGWGAWPRSSVACGL